MSTHGRKPDPQESLRRMVHGLAIACPLEPRGDKNPEGCILHDLREKPNLERFKLVEDMDAGELSEIFCHHCNCTAAKAPEEESAAWNIRRTILGQTPKPPQND
jgi:hypothetical protein